VEGEAPPLLSLPPAVALHHLHKAKALTGQPKAAKAHHRSQAPAHLLMLAAAQYAVLKTQLSQEKMRAVRVGAGSYIFYLLSRYLISEPPDQVGSTLSTPQYNCAER
jgi:hypothetical protein